MSRLFRIYSRIALPKAKDSCTSAASLVFAAVGKLAHVGCRISHLFGGILSSWTSLKIRAQHGEQTEAALKHLRSGLPTLD
jgi:hypothetical protein